ncbi:MAG: M42 family metallopeptidase [Anaerolineales bacterium]|nr:M42 family metallopeptidase [Anaerolineales bacterium]
MKSLIKKLTSVTGPSGYEKNIRQVIQDEIEPTVKKSGWQARVDALGNLIVSTPEPKAGGLKIMLSAHMDEIGLIVTHVDEDGFARFTTIGGVRPLNCVGGHVRFVNGAVGVIGQEDSHQPKNAPAIDQMYIDLGMADRKNCPVKVGDVAAFERPPIDLGKRMVSKAMDDRVGVAILIETMRQMKSTPHQVFFVFSAQEEVGVRGAITAAYGIDPDIGLALDVTRTGDTPKGIKMEVALGRGPAIKVRDSGMLADPRLVELLVQTSHKAKIPYQMEVLEAGSTDARAIQLTRAGVPAGCLSIPCRYIHSPSEMIDLDDVTHTVKLLLVLLQNSIELK